MQVCQSCGGEIVQGLHESNYTYARRMACSRACAGVLKKAPRGPEDEKVCRACNQVFKRNDHQSRSQFKAKVTCDKTCAAIYRNRERAMAHVSVESRVCVICDRELVSKDDEQKSRFKKRQVCSTTCSRIYLKERKRLLKIERERPTVKAVVLLPTVPAHLIERELTRRALRPAAWMFAPDTSGILPHEVPY